MKTKIGHSFLTTLTGTLLAIGVTSNAHALATITLPTTSFDGLSSQQYDQGTIFSASLLDQVQTAGYLPGNTSNFLPATGSGTLGVIVYTSNAVSNPVPFAKPMDALNSGDFDGTWGAGNAGTVGALRTLLTIGATNYQPLFIFDHNENARSPNLEISGKISIYRGNAVNPLASYALDTIANGAYDQSAYVLSCGEPSIGPAAPTPYGPCSIPAATDSGNTYSWKTTGSGKPDYYAIFDDLNLYDVNYLDSDKIVIQMSLRGNESGFEELAIGGYKYASTNVPEPGSLAMLGLGFGLMAFISRRRAGKSA